MTSIIRVSHNALARSTSCYPDAIFENCPGIVGFRVNEKNEIQLEALYVVTHAELTYTGQRFNVKLDLQKEVPQLSDPFFAQDLLKRYDNYLKSEFSQVSIEKEKRHQQLLTFYKSGRAKYPIPELMPKATPKTTADGFAGISLLWAGAAFIWGVNWVKSMCDFEHEPMEIDSTPPRGRSNRM